MVSAQSQLAEKCRSSKNCFQSVKRNEWKFISQKILERWGVAVLVWRRADNVFSLLAIDENLAKNDEVQGPLLDACTCNLLQPRLLNAKLTVCWSSRRTWSYSDMATQNIMAVTFSKQWIHFLRSERCPTSICELGNYIQQKKTEGEPFGRKDFCTRNRNQLKFWLFLYYT